MALPDDVHAFLRHRVETFEQLESLLLLWRERDHGWTVEQLATRTKLRPSAVSTALDELIQMGLVERYGEEAARYYRFSETSPATESTLEHLQHAYADDTLAVIKLMNKNAIERLRTSAIRTFAEAFVVSRKKDG
jgi:DNA-binding MarR family transcriptional regulator